MTRPLHIRRHIRAMMLHRLKTPHRTPELRPLFHIFHGHIHHGLGAADHLDAVGGGGAGQRPLNDRPGPAHFAKHGFSRHRRAVQPHLAKALVADGADLLHRHPRRIRRHKKQADAILRLAPGVPRARGDDDDIGSVGIRHKQLRPRQNVPPAAAIVRNGRRRRLNAPRLRSSRRLRKRQRQPHRPGANPGQQILLLLLAPRIQHRQPPQDDGSEVGNRRQRPPHLLNQHRQIQKRPSRPPVLLGKGYPRPPQARHLPPQLLRIAPRVLLQLPHQRQRRLLRQKLPRRILQHLLNLAQSHIHKAPHLRRRRQPPALRRPWQKSNSPRSITQPANGGKPHPSNHIPVLPACAGIHPRPRHPPPPKPNLAKSPD